MERVLLAWTVEPAAELYEPSACKGACLAISIATLDAAFVTLDVKTQPRGSGGKVALSCGASDSLHGD